MISLSYWYIPIERDFEFRCILNTSKFIFFLLFFCFKNCLAGCYFFRKFVYFWIYKNQNPLTTLHFPPSFLFLCIFFKITILPCLTFTKKSQYSHVWNLPKIPLLNRLFFIGSLNHSDLFASDQHQEWASFWPQRGLNGASLGPRWGLLGDS